MKSAHLNFAGKMLNIFFSSWEKNHVEGRNLKSPHSTDGKLTVTRGARELLDLTVRSLQEPSSPDILIFPDPVAAQ